jgi:hypothetical protein
MKKILQEGEALNPWYAVAYLSPNSFSYVCYPIGIHLIVGLWRKIYNKVRTTPIDASEFIIFSKSYDKGYAKGEENAKKVFKEQIPVIIKDLLEEESNILFSSKKKQQGWILRFIEERQAQL